MTWIAWIVGALRTKLGQGVAAGIAALALFWGVFRAGQLDEREDAEADEMQRAYEAERTRDEIDRNAADGDAHDRLRDDWKRRD